MVPRGRREEKRKRVKEGEEKGREKESVSLFVILVIRKKVEVKRKGVCIYFVWFLERKAGKVYHVILMDFM